MRIEDIKRVQQAQPFRPFTINLADGRSLHVPHREFLSHHPTGRTIIVYEGEDGFSIIDVMLVTSLDIHPTPPNQEAA